MIFDIFDQARFQESRTIPTSALMDERLEYVCEVDELGYGTYWSSEHHAVASHPLTIPNLFLAAAARATAKVRLGVMCTVLPLHHPIRVAEETALLDHLSHGRFSLGIGRGVGKHEFDKWATPMEDTQEIFDEHLRALEVLFSGAGRGGRRVHRARSPRTLSGHVAYWREADRVLIAGDVFVNMHILTMRPGLRPPLRVLTFDPGRNEASMRRLAGLRPRVALFGHGPPLSDADAKLAGFVENL